MVHQIHYSPRESVTIDVVVLNRTFLTGGDPEPQEDGIPPESWRVSAGHFSHEVVDQFFESARFSSRGGQGELEEAGFDVVNREPGVATGFLRYAKDWGGQIPGDQVRFFMAILPHEKAKEMHPDLPELKDGERWTAAFLVEPSEKQEELSGGLEDLKLYDPNRWPLDRAVDALIARELFSKGRTEMLEWHLRETLWTSILDLDHFTRRGDLDPTVAELATDTLQGIAESFQKNPMEPPELEDPGIAEKIEKAMAADEDREGIAGELHRGFGELGGVFEMLEEMGVALQARRYVRYLKTQAVVDRLTGGAEDEDGGEARPE